MIFAPVIIPTLNRYEHFRKCLESLEACTGAEKTDVYVALDFPPSEKYVEGWKKTGGRRHRRRQGVDGVRWRIPRAAGRRRRGG